MAKIDRFMAARHVFGGADNALMYFILVEVYEKYLKGQQLEDFVSARSIDEMLNLLSDEQFYSLRDFIIDVDKAGRGLSRISSRSDFSVSDWFYENIIDENCKTGLRLGKEPYFRKVEEVSSSLINKIDAIKVARISDKEHKKEVIKNYKERLKNFDGNSVEYRKWIMLSMADQGIPGINRIYDINKLLRGLSIEYLEDLREEGFGRIDAIAMRHNESTFTEIRKFEPYFYELLSDPDKDKRIVEARTFWKVRDELKEQIDKIIKEKKELGLGVADSDKVVKRIRDLETSPRFYEDVIDIIRSSESDFNETGFRRAISDYCRPDTLGNQFGKFLRRAVFLKKLAEGKISNVNFSRYKTEILKVQKYFFDHLLDQDITVYRGMGFDGLLELLKSLPEDKAILPTGYKFGDQISDEERTRIIDDINTQKPVVFDESLMGTSLVAKVSSGRDFGGKKPGGVFMTIQIPKGSRALVLENQSIFNQCDEEEVVLAARTKIRLNSIKVVDEHFEVEAQVLKR